MNNALNHNHVPFRSTVFINYSTLGGVCSSLGSMFGKLAGSFQDVGLLSTCMFLLMLGCNSIGMLFFAKGLQASPSSIHATIVSSASNYVSTAIIGSVIFGEKTPFIWWFGTSFIISGIVIISFPESLMYLHFD